VLRAVESVDHESAIVLDVGTGTGDIAARLRGVTVGLDLSESLLRVARRHLDGVVAGSALALPLRDGCADVVVCSQLLHHFEGRDLIALVQELHRVARGVVVVTDIRRSWLAAGGFWLASTALRFHHVTRHEGVVSVMRGFTASELRDMVRGAIGIEPWIGQGTFWRLTAIWHKGKSVRGR
jgi:ubiquinone/menaquinone biosynthesis C-methylase UbiE